MFFYSESQNIFRPTVAEWESYEANSDALDTVVHTTLVTGDGRENGVKFVEFQDSYGEEVGVDGFVSFLEMTMDMGFPSSSM